ncbi:MAG TPA: response regulator transcription factor [Patescibacteria group bacterium]|jgi:two-component system alkaline phosphatase synthesis response regulator PhoP|nr:response regulator transcription factor [Patescibacteria group bacterium]
MPKVLIVEDDESMGTALKDGFSYEGYEVVFAGDGVEGLRLAIERAPDLVILDVMLPKMSGFDVCKEIRKTGSAVPVIMLTARGQEIDKVLGLKLGADDYVTKPFGFMELMARVEALLRRASGQTGRAESYTFGDVSVDFKRGEVRRKGKPIEMSAREMRLLQYFVEHRGEVIARDRLLDEVWGYDEAPLTRTVDMHVAKLRKKIESRPADPQFLLTVHGMGYKFNG